MTPTDAASTEPTRTRFAASIGLFALALSLAVVPQAGAGALEDSTKLFQQGNSGEALERITAYLADHPDDARARFLKGVILTAQKKDDEAIATFTALIENYPELPEPYNNLAVLYASRGDYDKARDALEQAIENYPGYALAHENLGDLDAKLAARSYARALQLNNANPALAAKIEALRLLLAEPARETALPSEKGKR